MKADSHGYHVLLYTTYAVFDPLRLDPSKRRNNLIIETHAQTKAT